MKEFLYLYLEQAGMADPNAQQGLPPVQMPGMDPTMGGMMDPSMMGLPPMPVPPAAEKLSVKFEAENETAVQMFIQKFFDKFSAILRDKEVVHGGLTFNGLKFKLKFTLDNKMEIYQSNKLIESTDNPKDATRIILDNSLN